MTARRRTFFHIFCLHIALALTLWAGAATAQTQTAERPYDGTGSQWVRLPSSPPYDPSRDQAKKARIEAERQQYAKDATNNHPLAMLSLAALLEDGVTSAGFDPAGALDLYEKAADLGDVVGWRKMCVAYLLGEGRPVDRKKAAGYCNHLPQSDATHLFALAYDTDHAAHPDSDNDYILQTYLDAAKRGSAEAMDIIGQKAQALSSPAAARNWFRQGAALGSTDAIDHLALMTEAGQGGEADADEAYWLYINAGNRGNVHARAWLAARPPRQPLGQMSYEEKASFLMETTQRGNGPHVDHVGLDSLGHALESVYPPEYKTADITVHCYIGTTHNVDVCLPVYALPPGTDFTQSLNWLFHRQLNVADLDATQRPTAHTVLVLAFHWVR